MERDLNAVKYNRRALNRMLDDMIKMLKDDEDIVNILDLTTKYNITNKCFSNITSRLDDKPWRSEIQDKIDIIYDIIEQRRLVLGSKSKRPAWDIFILKAYHGKIEQQHIYSKVEGKTEHEGDINVNINYPK